MLENWRKWSSIWRRLCMFLGQAPGGVILAHINISMVALIHLFQVLMEIKNFWRVFGIDFTSPPKLLGTRAFKSGLESGQRRLLYSYLKQAAFTDSVYLIERRGKEQPVWSWQNKIKIYELSNLGRSHFVYILWLAMLNSYSRASECV